MSWADNAHHKLWQSSDGCRQAKMFLKGPDKQLPRFALGIKRKQLRILVGLLTRHIALNRHLSIIKIRTDPLCPACGEEEVTSYQLSRKCCAYMVRYSIMGAHTMEPEELAKVRPTTLLWFVKLTFGCIGVVHWVEHTRFQCWAASSVRPDKDKGKATTILLCH